jgi:hypothetical protein
MTFGFKSSLSRALVGLVALAAMTACSVSTAHLTDLSLSKDKDMSNPTTTFAPTDTVYAQSGVANTPSKVTLQWHFIAENVKGIPPNSLQKSNELSTDLPSDGTSSYSLTPPPSGWPAGTYKIVVDLMIDGTQKEEKSTEFTVGS